MVLLDIRGTEKGRHARYIPIESNLSPLRADTSVSIRNHNETVNASKYYPLSAYWVRDMGTSGTLGISSPQAPQLLQEKKFYTFREELMHHTPAIDGYNSSFHARQLPFIYHHGVHEIPCGTNAQCAKKTSRGDKLNIQ